MKREMVHKRFPIRLPDDIKMSVLLVIIQPYEIQFHRPLFLKSARKSDCLFPRQYFPVFRMVNVTLPVQSRMFEFHVAVKN